MGAHYFVLSFRRCVKDEEEDRLIKASMRGERGAFETLKKLYERPLLSYIGHRVPSHAVDDIAQDTWLGAWQAIHRWTGRARFKVWLFSIAEHKCIDYHRLSARHSRADYSEAMNHYASSDTNDYAAAELRETVQGLLVKLPPHQREVLELYYYDELTLSEIALLLKRNLNTTKYQFYRAHAAVMQGMSTLEGNLGVSDQIGIGKKQ